LLPLRQRFRYRGDTFDDDYAAMSLILRRLPRHAAPPLRLLLLPLFY